MVYLVKYALTDGAIQEMRETHYLADESLEGKIWFRFREDALKKAEEMRVKKIALLQRQIAKLEKMHFE
jgi:hypothetical protein